MAFHIASGIASPGHPGHQEETLIKPFVKAVTADLQQNRANGNPFCWIEWQNTLEKDKSVSQNGHFVTQIFFYVS